MQWLTDPDVAPGTRNAPVEKARSRVSTFEKYEDRWDLLSLDQRDVPLLLPPKFREWVALEAVGLPPGHPWNHALPEW